MSSVEDTRKENAANSDNALLNLTIDGSFEDAEVRDVTRSSTSVGHGEAVANKGFKTPCTIHGITAGLSGGALGYAFGFVGYWFRHRLKGSWKASLLDAGTSAKTFGLMGGLYAGVNCFMLRLRQCEDSWNSAASGCATGLALGWKGGPLSALQSCFMLGIFSYFIEGMGGGSAEAHAASCNSLDEVLCSVSDKCLSRPDGTCILVGEFARKNRRLQFSPGYSGRTQESFRRISCSHRPYHEEFKDFLAVLATDELRRNIIISSESERDDAVQFLLNPAFSILDVKIY